MRCAACNSTNTHLSSVGRSSVAGYRCITLEESIAAPLFDISLVFCNDCNLVSQKRYPEADRLLDKLYVEHASTQHSEDNPYFQAFSVELGQKYSLSNSSKVLEIGCNCGTFLKVLSENTSARVYGVEPSLTMKEIWADRDLFVVNDYFNQGSVSKLMKEGPFDVIYFRHVFEHVPDPVEFIRLAQSLLSENGTIVLESPYLESIFKYGRYETMGYSHLHQYCIRSLNAIFAQFNLGLIDYELVDNDGGSIVAHFQKNRETKSNLFEQDLKTGLSNYLNYGRAMRDRAELELKKYNNNEVIGYGAGAKGQHLIHVLGLDRFVSNVVDDTPGFVGKFIPGTAIQIIDSAILDSKDLRAVVNLAPTHLEAIKKQVPSHLDLIDFINQ